jgi:hypothetical protein
MRGRKNNVQYGWNINFFVRQGDVAQELGIVRGRIRKNNRISTVLIRLLEYFKRITAIVSYKHLREYYASSYYVRLVARSSFVRRVRASVFT